MKSALLESTSAQGTSWSALHHSQEKPFFSLLTAEGTEETHQLAYVPKWDGRSISPLPHLKAPAFEGAHWNCERVWFIFVGESESTCHASLWYTSTTYLVVWS